MRWITYHFSVSAVALGAMSGGAYAQVTAEQVWENWRGFSREMGQSVVTGSETRSGDRLTITDAMFSVVDTGVEITSKFGQISFRDLADGTVEITFSPSFTLTLNSTETAKDDVNIDLTFRQDGLQIIANQDDGGLRYDMAANSIALAVDRFEAEGEDTVVAGGALIGDLTGTYFVGDVGSDRFRSAFDAARITMDITAESATNRSRMSFSAELTDPSGSSEARKLSALVEQADSRAGLPEGFELKAGYRVGSGSYRLDFDGPAGSAVTAIESDGATLDLLFDTETLRYDVTGGATSVTVSGSGVPVPEANLSLAGSRMAFTLPVGQGDGPQDISVVARLEGLELGPELWSLVDPSNVLPRDPATLIVDLAGTAKWLVDPFNPAAMAAFKGGLPAEIYQLDLQDLQLTALGAKVAGTGGFTFDNNDLVSYDGVPKPVGEINLTIDGANQLIDRLFGLGLMPQNQAMNARMMLGLFARPGEGPDALTSKIEMRPDGTVHANDQRLK